MHSSNVTCVMLVFLSLLYHDQLNVVCSTDMKRTQTGLLALIHVSCS